MSTVYEPGSVFKMFTAAAVLGDGKVTTKSKFTDTGTLWLDGGRARVDDADRKAKGRMSFEDAIAYSRNVVAAKAALQLGKNRTPRSAAVRRWTQLGFGQPSGIDVANEVGGLVRDPSQPPWARSTLPTAPSARASPSPRSSSPRPSAMLNGGVLVQPRVVKTVGDRETSPVARAGSCPRSSRPRSPG